MLRKTNILTLLLVLLLSGSLFGEAFRIHWGKSPSPNLVRYVVYRSTALNTGFVAIDSTGAAPGDTTYTDNNVPTGTRHFYRVRAVASDGQRSVFSVPVDGLHVAPADPAPESRIVSVVKTAPSSYRVTWVTTAPSAGFVLLRIVGQASWSVSAWDISLTTTHTLTLTGFTEPAQYEFRASSYMTPSPTSVTVSPSFFATLTPTPEPPSTKGIYPF